MLKSSIKHKIRFFYSDKSYHIKESMRIKKFVEYIFSHEGKTLDSMTYIFCSDRTLLTINKKYLKHSYLTDIITFDLSENKAGVGGESYISIDRIKANSKRLNIPFRKELLRVIFHGPLHLCGYDDKSKKTALTMREKEDYYLSHFLSR